MCIYHLQTTMEQKCGSEVEWKIETTLHGNIMINVQLSLTRYNGVETDDVWQSSGEEDKDNIHGNIIILVCSCHLHTTMEQRQTMCGSEVERKIKTTGVHGNIMINVQLSLTPFNGAETGDVQWLSREEDDRNLTTLTNIHLTFIEL